MRTTKKNIIIAHGHLYLFRSTGVYYTAEMASRFNVILVVPEAYRNDKKFQLACETLKIETVVFYTYCDKNLKRHIAVSKCFKQALHKYQPVAVIQHDYLGIENMYLFHWARKLDAHCQRVVILSSMPSSDNTHKIVEEFMALTVERYAAKLKLPKFFLDSLIRLGKYSRSLLCNKLLPATVLKSRPYFPLSLYSNIDIIPKRQLFDYFLIYEQCEQAYLQKLFKHNNYLTPQAFVRISCPIADRLGVNDVIYNVKAGKMVAIFPSLIGYRHFELEKDTLEKWIKALGILRSQLPDYRFVIKFHPGNPHAHLDKVKAYFKRECGFIDFIESNVAAELLMLQSAVVVGDVSTTLWWSNFLTSKVVFSLGMGDYSTSVDMHSYPDVLYVEQMDELAQIDIPQIIAGRKTAAVQSKYPNVAGFVESIT